MEIKLEALHGCSSAQINSQTVRMQMFLQTITAHTFFSASQVVCKYFSSGIYSPQ